MGSLMAGWDSPRTAKKGGWESPRTAKKGGWESPRTAKKGFERNMSLTKEEIQQFWRGKARDQQSPPTSSAPSPSNVNRNIQRSNTFPPPEEEHDQYGTTFLPVPLVKREILKSRTFNGREAVAEIHPDLVIGSAPAGWWTKTDLAFLNERPVLESISERPNSYFAQQDEIARKMKMKKAAEASAGVPVF